MISRIIESVSLAPILAVLIIIPAVAILALAGSYALEAAWRRFKKRNVKLAVVIMTDLLLMGAIVTGASDLYVKNLEQQTRDSAAKFAAVLNTEAASIAKHSEDARLGSAVYSVLDLLGSARVGGQPDSDSLRERFRRHADVDFKYKKTPPFAISKEFASQANRARHGYSIIPQLIDPATSESERILLWQKMEYIADDTDSHREKWSNFTKEYQDVQTSYSGNTTQDWFKYLTRTYERQRAAANAALPSGLWSVLGFIAAVLGLAKAFADFRAKHSDGTGNSPLRAMGSQTPVLRVGTQDVCGDVGGGI